MGSGANDMWEWWQWPVERCGSNLWGVVTVTCREWWQ